jgi:hypothetical protein
VRRRGAAVQSSVSGFDMTSSLSADDFACATRPDIIMIS